MKRFAAGLRAAAAVAGLLLAARVLAGPVTVVDDRGRTLTFAAPPQRIVTLIPSLTETVCALGACARLVAVDRFSDWPERVNTLPRLGGMEDTPVERVLALRPDVVLAPGSVRAVDRLQALGLAVVTLEPKRLADTERVIGQVAALLGEPEAGRRLWAAMQAGLDAAARGVPAGWRGRRVYFEVASTPYAAGESSFVGEVLSRLGLGNIVPASLGPFPALNPEFVVRAQPDIVMAGAAAVAEMPQRPGWQALTALQEGRSCGFPAARYEFLVRPGPRLAEAAEVMAQCLKSLPPPR